MIFLLRKDDNAMVNIHFAKKLRQSLNNEGTVRELKLGNVFQTPANDVNY